MSAQAKRKYFAKGHKHPICVNLGCNNKVTVREWKYWSFKSECSRCIGARKAHKRIPGVTIHKKEFCENYNGHLGFVCPIKIPSVSVEKMKKIWKEFLPSLDLDHLDSDHTNNDPENVKTYCKLCHTKRSQKSGDWNSTKSSSRNIE